jgi:hypothetical protein
VSIDESFCFYDSLIRRVWIDEDRIPVVRITGSHQHSCISGAVSMEGKQLFRQYDIFNADTFLDYLKLIRAKFRKYYLFMDKSSQHYKSMKVIKYFEENKDTLIPIYLRHGHNSRSLVFILLPCYQVPSIYFIDFGLDAFFLQL